MQVRVTGFPCQIAVKNPRIKSSGKEIKINITSLINQMVI